jgi:hypothetical protein
MQVVAVALDMMAAMAPVDQVAVAHQVVQQLLVQLIEAAVAEAAGLVLMELLEVLVL